MSNIIKVIKDFLQDESLVITPETNLSLDLGMSSFDLMELSCEMEDEYNIKFEAEELANIQSVQDLHQLIETKYA